jgi:N-acyl homoserine lactone hydrolase
MNYSGAPVGFQFRNERRTDMAVEEIFILPSGLLTLDRSIFIAQVDMGQKIKASVYSVLLIHTEGPVLIDVGLNPVGLTDPERAWGPRAKLIKPEFTEADDIRNRLKELDLKVSDIKMVIITHLHWDHTGGLRFFEDCPIVVQREEYRFAFNPDSYFSPQYMRNHFDFPLNYQNADGDQIILPGISVIKTPGHTPGHQSVLVKTVRGNYYLFTGDAINSKENLDRKIPSSNNWNNGVCLDSMSRLQHLSQLLEAEIIYGHDIIQWEALKKLPESYR